MFMLFYSFSAFYIGPMGLRLCVGGSVGAWIEQAIGLGRWADGSG
jgi:hypothetical protein